MLVFLRATSDNTDQILEFTDKVDFPALLQNFYMRVTFRTKYVDTPIELSEVERANEIVQATGSLSYQECFVKWLVDNHGAMVHEYEEYGAWG